MNGPKRIQRQRTRDWRMPEGAIVVSRPSRWGNPWRVGGMAHIDPCPSESNPVCFEVTPRGAVALFRLYAEARDVFDVDWLRPLRGLDLACFCEPDEPCHADVLLELANR